MGYGEDFKPGADSCLPSMMERTRVVAVCSRMRKVMPWVEKEEPRSILLTPRAAHLSMQIQQK